MRTVTLHANDAELLAEKRQEIQHAGWTAYRDGFVSMLPVAVSLGERVTEDARRDFALHETIEIPEDPIRGKICSCCGARTRGRHWHNRDAGYGLCVTCADRINARGKMDAEEMLSCYGRRGYHYDVEVAP